MAFGRKETTRFLGELLVKNRLSGIGKYWASEVSIDPWTAKGKRVDFMQFIPPTQCCLSDIEKGIFVCYEIKSCKEDIYSGNGLNFLGEKNYIITTMQCYKDVIIPDMRSGKFWNHLKNSAPESSNYVGVMVAIPYMWDVNKEFEKPTPLTDDMAWELKVVMPCRVVPRRRSITEILFCMLRSGK